MIAVARGRFLPVSPRKMRLVARLVKGMEVAQALPLLEHLKKQAARPFSKVLKSAVASATREGKTTPERLTISRIWCDEGPGARRFRAAPMGRASGFRKKLCHLTIELDLKKNGS